MILTEIVLKPKGKEIVLWSVSMTIPQARDFILTATGRRIGKNILYFHTEVKQFFIPLPFRRKVLDKQYHNKDSYFKKPLYVKTTRITNPKPPDRIKTIRKKPSNEGSISGRGGAGVDPIQRKDVGKTPVFKMAPNGSQESEHSEFDH